MIVYACILHISSQSTIISKPGVRGFWANSLTKPPFGVTSAEVAVICSENIYIYIYIYYFFLLLLTFYIHKVVHSQAFISSNTAS